jgi:hypothetical protein
MPADNPIRAAVPAINFHLTPTQRERVSPGFDVDALERLLAQVAPARRQEILSYFLKPEPNTPRGGMLTHIKDPELQALLEEVWAPVWDQVGASGAELRPATGGRAGDATAPTRRLLHPVPDRTEQHLQRSRRTTRRDSAAPDGDR